MVVDKDVISGAFGFGEKLIVRNYADMVKADEGIIGSKDIRVLELEAIVDTGTTHVCLPKGEIARLGLGFHKTIKVRTAQGIVEHRLFKGAEMELKGRTFVMEVMENEEDNPCIIGSLLLEALDFVVDPARKVIPNPAHEEEWIVNLA